MPLRALLTALLLTTPALAATCEDLRLTQLPHATIELAQSTPAGQFTPPNETLNPQTAAPYQRLPAFCRVAATLTPTPDSHIAIEVWLPLPTAWNRKLQGEGNGGFAGSIAYNIMAGALAQNYAVAATDTGHQGQATDSDWALHHPEKITDFGYRAIHEMTAAAKSLTAAFYGTAPQRSYFVGCSDGGREALMEAQRYPADYDGILAGAPAYNWTHMLASGVDISGTLFQSDSSFIPSTKISAIAQAVLKACDSLDGVTDGILNDPSACHFDPAALLCPAADSDTCLTAPQVKSLAKIYAGGRTSKGELIFPGLLPGGEEGRGGWKAWVLGESRGKGEGSAYMNGFFKNMVFDDPAWTLKATSIDTALHTADEKLAQKLNATDPNLTAFDKRGGKLILYHGWNDPAISPLATITYYNAVLARMSPAETEKFVRLYMVPGMQHCYEGPGPNLFGQFPGLPQRTPSDNIYVALEQWVEHDAAPANILAAKFTGNKPTTVRPLCPYPLAIQYNGSGDPNLPASFTCSKPKAVSPVQAQAPSRVAK